MRAVLIAVLITGLLAISVRAQESCVTPEYTTDIVPVCQANQRIKLPSYADPTSYYSCTTGKPVLTKCQAPTGYFSYVLQECTSCAKYIPAVACEEIKLDLKCVPISESGVTTAAPPGNSTAAPTTVTTAAPTTVTTKDPTTAAPTTAAPTTAAPTTAAPTTAAPTTAAPTTAAPTTVTTANPDSTLTTGASTTVDGNEPSGTTISVPNPPSPNDPDVPAPPTPEPTVGTIVPGPPTVAA